MFKRIILIFSLLLPVTFYTTDVLADGFVECSNCTDGEIKNAAAKWAQNNLTKTDYKNGVSKTVHVLDLGKRMVVTYLARLTYVKPPEEFLPEVYVPILSDISDSSGASNIMKDYDSAVRTLIANAKEIVITDKTLSHAWDFLLCNYCETALTETISAQLSSESELASLRRRQLAQLAGLDFVDNYVELEFKTEDGGTVEATLTMSQDMTKLRVIITSVKDKDGNKVPFNLPLSDLIGIAIKIPDLDTAASINSILNDIGLSIDQKVGVVRIEECGVCKD